MGPPNRKAPCRPEDVIQHRQTPPTPPAPPPCVHRWVFIESLYTVESGSYQMCWKRRDRFYCEHCLEQRETKKEEWSRERPGWFAK